MDDLIKQLRKPIAGDTPESWNQRQRAADALEAKDAEIKQLQDVRRDLIQRVGMSAGG